MNQNHLIWVMRQPYLSLQRINSEFCIPWISINPVSFRFFYVWKSLLHGSLKVTVTSFAPHKERHVGIREDTLLHTVVQPFSSLGEYEVGVISTDRLSRPGQVLTLFLSLQKETDLFCSLPVLRQDREETQIEVSRYGIPGGHLERYFPDLELHGPVRREQVSYFRKKIPGKSVSDMPCVCFRIDDPTVVKIISQVDFITIAGKQNFGLLS